MMLTLTGISQPASYRVNKPVRIENKYCFEREDVLKIIHNEVKAFECDTLIQLYDNTEHLYGSTVAARDSAISAQKKINSAQGSVIALQSKEIDLVNQKLKISNKETFRWKLKTLVTNTTLAAVITAVTIIAVKFGKH